MNSHIKEAGLFRRVVAYVIDMLIVIIGYAIVSLSITGPYMQPALGYDTLLEEVNEYCLDTGIIYGEYDEESGELVNLHHYYYDYLHTGNEADSSGNLYCELPEGKEAWEAYYDLAYTFVTETIPSRLEADDERYSDLVYTVGNEQVVVGSRTNYTYKDYFAEEFLNLPGRDSALYSTEADRLYGDSTFFQYALKDDGTPDFEARPVLRSSFDTSNENTLRELTEYFFDLNGGSSYTEMGVYGHAVALALGQDENPTQVFYSNGRSQLSMITWVCALPAYVPFVFIVFLIVPLCSPHSKTPGKWLMRLSVIGLDGYAAKMSERVPRALFLCIIALLPMLPGSFQVYGLFGFLIIALIDYMVLVLSKSKQSIHDKLTHTIEVDARETIVFKNEEEKEEFLHLHPEMFPGYKDPKARAEDEHIAMLDSILDSSTIDRNRIEARNITNFDEFEAKKEEEFNDALRRLAEQKEAGLIQGSRVTKASVNLMKEEGPEETPSVTPEKTQNHQNPPQNPAGFLDSISEDEDEVLPGDDPEGE